MRVYSIVLSFVFIIIVLGGCTMGKRSLKEVPYQYATEVFFQNPQNISQIGDPFLLKASDGKYYCYPTSDSGNGFKVWTSEDMITWTKQPINVFSKSRTTWAKSDFWAPEVYEWDGKFYMYYTARWKETDTLRIGLAISDSPMGPFLDTEDKPFFDFGYAAIDANVFVDDDGKAYLYFARDCSENIYNGKHESHIYGVALSDDRMSVVGEPVLLTRPQQPWEAPDGEWRWNEGPFVLKHNGSYYLMYSANYFADVNYSLGYATSDSPLGTYVKYEHNPVLATQKDWKDISGPGHHSVIASAEGSTLYVAYHTHSVPAMGGGNRQLNLDVMGFRDDGSLFINGPSLHHQLLPKYADQGSKVKEAVTSDSRERFLPLFDGEVTVRTDFPIMPRSVPLNKSEPIEIVFDRPQTISYIVLYTNNVLNNAEGKLKRVNIELSNGTMMKDITIDPNSVEPVAISFDPTEVEWLKIDNAEDEGSGEVTEINFF